VPAKNAAAEAPADETAEVVKEYPSLVPQRPSDWDHPNTGWTVQHGTSYVNTDPVPGQVFVPEQLPNPDLQRTISVDPAVHNAGLVVLSREEAAQHPGGPEPHDPLAGTGVYPGLADAASRTVPSA
jgi:hypothetical protein